MMCAASLFLLMGAIPNEVGPEAAHCLFDPGRQLRAGDVVLRRGTGLWSDLFARLNSRDRRFSHAGIVVKDGAGWGVVHAEADDLGRRGRIRLDEWAVFAGRARQLAVLRLHGDETGAAARVAESALKMHAAALPFDFDFDLSRTEAVYCSELVWRALRDALGRDPLPEKALVRGREVILVENLILDVAGLTSVCAGY